MIKQETIVDGIALFFLLIVGFVIYLLMVSNDIEVFKESRNLLSFVPTVIGGFVILCNWGFNKAHTNRLDSPTLLKGAYNADLGSLFLDFKQNGECIMLSAGILSDSYEYGTYDINDSIITIHALSGNNFICNKLLIRSQNQSSKDGSNAGNSNKGYLMCIDNKGNEVKNGFHFNLFEDNRK
ncbi:MAG TPA: hypothetical protein VGF79_12590 [Bacteroidia bacterium]